MRPPQQSSMQDAAYMHPQMSINSDNNNHRQAQAAAAMQPYEEEKKEFGGNNNLDMNFSAFQDDTPSCVYCNRNFTSEEQSSGKVQMFLADGCFHQYHQDCFKGYAKKTLLTKLPTGEFADCRCRKCNTVVQAEDLREALGQQMLQDIRD